MFKDFIKRENEIFGIIRAFLDNNLDFVIIGGYAVSAYKHRFSVDVDVVIRKKDLEKFKDILEKNGFKKTISKELENIYSSVFMRFEKKTGLVVNVDLLVDGMGIRQTNGAVSFDTLFSNGDFKKVKGIEKEIMVRIPSKELLIALKLHAGRLTDFRDVAVLMKKVDITKIKEFLDIGDKEIVKKHVKKLLSLINERGFMDSFKGIFAEKKYDVDLNEVRKLEAFIK